MPLICRDLSKSKIWIIVTPFSPHLPTIEKEIVSLQRRCANNLNQIAVLANTYGGVYPDEIKALQKDYADLWGPLSELLEKLSEVVAL